MKSFVPKDQDEPPARPTEHNVGRNFRGETRSNETYAPTTDPDARLYRKSMGFLPCVLGAANGKTTRGSADGFLFRFHNLIWLQGHATTESLR
ncbi:hypothetical protein SAMN02746095_02120 [Acidocella aminolytica 101 = DSM 11237]|uniref:Uncharacterized protein n=1 Tax=Acidocella aminolytica 101 = DSM 11237 TaxID=1120923 RepID=A0A0D6PGN7_9PROT|nr:hypothetical protein Aam_063_012 [Acidocella aminolytica 101 = DSM 11237]GBQ34752.1 hypothetical protein AA11237_0815 [Acidocella aminolytica 101 = DSM 11237]SHF10260.1 hypothetical protein SAMN02746095_02120 [Acidocella aminolytica 101 = DSM 11237]